jgi:hypothetical protein
MTTKTTTQTSQTATNYESILTHELLKSTTFFKSLQSKNVRVFNKITSSIYGTIEVAIFYSSSMLATDAEQQIKTWLKQPGKKIACFQSVNQLSQFVSNNNFGANKQLEQSMITKAMIYNFFHFGDEQISSIMHEL